MLTIQQIVEAANYRKDNEFRGLSERLLKLTVSKFFNKVEEQVIDFELVNYVSNSKLRVPEYDRIAIIYLSLDTLLGDDNYYFDELLKENNFKNYRELTNHVLGW